MVGFSRFLFLHACPIGDASARNSREMRKLKREYSNNYQVGDILIWVGVPKGFEMTGAFYQLVIPVKSNMRCLTVFVTKHYR